MLRKITCLFAAFTALFLIQSALFAHHGTSVTYQVEKTMTLNGTVTEFAFSYPHPQLYFDVKDEKGEVQHWGSEFGPTPMMMKNAKLGWSRDSIKPGDQVTITCSPHKQAGAHVCLLKELVINGKKMPTGNPGGGQGPGKE